MPDEDPQVVIAVLEHVHSHPGITQAAVRDELGLGWYEAGRALKHLLESGMLEQEGKGRERTFTVAEAPSDEETFSPLARSDPR